MEIQEIFKRIAKLKIAIIGDVMVDSYIYGKVNRMSPEAPVPVVDVFKKENRLGGAGNVALNVKALGATPLLISIVGKDEEGSMVGRLLNNSGISDAHILQSNERKTTVKTRILGNNRQIARVDQELVQDLDEMDNSRLIQTAGNILEGVDLLILEDYDKGILNKANIHKIIAQAQQLNVPIVVDPKFNNFDEFKGVTLFKPNLKELLTGLEDKVDSDYSIDTIVTLEEKLRSKLNHQISLITLSERGVLIRSEDHLHTADAHSRNITDVSGAGDTVISVAGCVLAAGGSIEMVAEISNLAGGLVCEHAGVVPIDMQRLLAEATKLG